MLLSYGEAASTVSDVLARSVLSYLISQRLTTSRNPLRITRGASALKLFHEFLPNTFLQQKHSTWICDTLKIQVQEGARAGLC